EFHSETFDFVFALLVLQHLDMRDVRTYLGEIYRILKNEGKAYLQFPNRQFRYLYEAQLEKRRYDVARTRWYSGVEVMTELRSVGFRIIAEHMDGFQIVEICRKSNLPGIVSHS